MPSGRYGYRTEGPQGRPAARSVSEDSQSRGCGCRRLRHQKNIINGFKYSAHAPAAKPGDDLLFHRLSDSTIGAVRFHGRVRDGIGWVTDAMATKLWGRRIGFPSK